MAAEALVQDSVRSSEVELPQWMVPVAGASKVTMRSFEMQMLHRGKQWDESIAGNLSFEMQMPHRGEQWDDSIGGNLYGEKRGKLSKDFLDLLKSDCGGCPMWPDPEDPSSAQAAEQTPREKFLFAPPFLMFGYFPRGRFAAGDSHLGKTLAKMSVGRYDWLVSHELHGINVFRLHLDHKGEVSRTVPRPNSDQRVPSVLALHPSVRLDRLGSLEEYQELIIGMSQVATIMKRAVVYPEVPCNLPWLKDPNADPKRPLQVSQWWFPRVPAGVKFPGHECSSDMFGAYREEGERASDSSGNLNYSSPLDPSPLCTLSMLTYDSCMVEGKGMLGAEFEHLMARYNALFPLLPGRSNTFLWPETSTLPTGAASINILVVQKDSVERAATEFSKWPVVYLGHPVQVMTPEKKWAKGYEGFEQPCYGLERKALRDRLGTDFTATKATRSMWGRSKPGINRFAASIQTGGILHGSRDKVDLPTIDQ
eukprot:gene10221-8139_t